MSSGQFSSSVSMKIFTPSGEYIAPCTVYPSVLMDVNAIAKHCKSVSPCHGPSLIWLERVLPRLKMKMLGGSEWYGLTNGWRYFIRLSFYMKIKVLTWPLEVAANVLSLVSPAWVLYSADMKA